MLASSHTVIIYNGVHAGISFITLRISLKEPISNDAILSHYDSSSFVLPRSVLAAAQKENHSYCKCLLLVMVCYRDIHGLQFKQYLTVLLD